MRLFRRDWLKRTTAACRRDRRRNPTNVGERYNRNFGNAWTYNQIPDSLRSQYNLDQTDRYYYNNGYLYRVDPRTSVVEQVVSALLR